MRAADGARSLGFGRDDEKKPVVAVYDAPHHSLLTSPSLRRERLERPAKNVRKENRSLFRFLLLSYSLLLTRAAWL
jgi:hypothetical protein